MKRIKSSIFAGLFCLLLLLPNFWRGGLKDITKPHLGVYECVEATVNGKDFLDKYDEMNLELKPNGKFLLHACEKGEKAQELTGEYTFDRDSGEFCIVGTGSVYKRKFTLREGVLTVFMQYGNKNICLKFEQK